MRYQMLWHLYLLAEAQECRRIQILSYFSKTGSVISTYQCGMCDVCKPGHNYLEKRNPPPIDRSIEEKEAELYDLVKNDEFNYNRLAALSAEFQDYKMARYIQAGRVLETAPENLPALYLSYKFASFNEASANAIRVIDVANRRKVRFADIESVYNDVPAEAKTRALPILNRINSATDSSEGRIFLEREASKRKQQSKEFDELHTYMQLFNIVESIDPSLLNSIKDKSIKLEVAYSG